MAKRTAISKKTRFEVFKRDSFKCQYCGRTSADVILEVDHITPIKEGGKSDILNLITSCFDCNRGKGARKISDDSVVKLQYEQLEMMNEKREQLKMFSEWRDELYNSIDEELNIFKKCIYKYYDKDAGDDFTLTGKRLIKKYGINEVINVLDIAFHEGTKYNYLSQTLDKYLKNRLNEREKPYLSKLYYIRAILKNRCGDYYNYSSEVLAFLEKIHADGASLIDMQYNATRADKYIDFKKIYVGDDV